MLVKLKRSGKAMLLPVRSQLLLSRDLKFVLAKIFLASSAVLTCHANAVSSVQNALLLTKRLMQSSLRLTEKHIT